MGPRARPRAACVREVEGEGETTTPPHASSSALTSSSPSASASAPTANGCRGFGDASSTTETGTSTTTTTTTTTKKCITITGSGGGGGNSSYHSGIHARTTSTSTSTSTCSNSNSNGRALVTSVAALAFTMSLSCRLMTSLGTGGGGVGEGEGGCRYDESAGGGVDGDGDDGEGEGTCHTVTSSSSPSSEEVRMAGYSVLATITVLSLALDRVAGTTNTRTRHRTRGICLWSWCKTASFTCMTTYILLMVFILHMPSLESARHILSTFFPDVGELSEYQRLLRIKIDTVMGSCSFSKETLFRQLFLCPWFLCHLVGYAWKMAIFRDWKVAFLAGLTFELWEVTLMYFVPEFEECWWDALFLDVLGGNLLGIIVGHHLNAWMFGGGGRTGGGEDYDGATTVPYERRPAVAAAAHAGNGIAGGVVADYRNGHDSSLPGDGDENGEASHYPSATTTAVVNGSIGGTNHPSCHTDPTTVDIHPTVEDMSRFDWFGERERTSPSSRILSLSSPLSSRSEYQILASPTRLGLVVCMIGLMLILETNQFLLNNALGVPNTSAFCTVRLLLIGLVGVPAGAEWYGYVEDCFECAKNDDDSGRRRRRGGDVDGTGTVGGMKCCLLLCFMAMVELAVVIKFFPAHMSIEIERTGSRFGIPHEVAIPHIISFGALSSWLMLRYVVVGYASSSVRARIGGEDRERAVLERLESSSSGENDDNHRRRWWCWWRNFRRLPPEYRREVLAHEAPDLLLIIAAIPPAYLFFIGWKWE